MKKRLLIVIPVVAALALAGLFLPARGVSIKPFGMLSLESKIVISIGYEVAYAMTGSGTIGDPWIIWDVDDLQAIEDNLGDWYELGQDIDASATSGWNYELYEPGYYAGFIPITLFTGSLDGKGYVVTDLYIGGNNASLKSKQQGLIYELVTPGTIQNLGLENITVIGDEKCGALVGKNTSGTISQCYATGSITKPSWGTKGKNLAGLVGNNKGTITDCYSWVDIVDGIEKNGGFIGKQEGGIIINCYSVGLVTGITSGGFNGEIKNVTADTFSDCFWDTETSYQGSDPAALALSKPTGETTANMKKEATFTNWDFTNVWGIEEGVTYPFLRVFPHISNSPTSKDFSFVAESSSYWSTVTNPPTWPLDDTECFFEVTNNSGAAVDIAIRAINFGGGVGWTLAGSPGEDTVTLKAGKSGDNAEIDMVTLTTGDQSFITGLADATSKKWEIKLETGTFTDGVGKSSTVTLTATLS